MQTLSSDKLLAITLRAIGDGVISCDTDGRILLMNAEAERLTGWTHAGAQGRPLPEVFRIVDESTRHSIENPVDRAFRFGAPAGSVTYTLLLQHGGGEVAIDESAAPVYDDDHQLRGAVLVFRDVTGRRRARRNLQLLSVSGRIFGEARDQAEILARISAVVTQDFAGLAIYDLLLPGGAMERILSPHRDPARDPAMQQLHSFLPGLGHPSHPVHATTSIQRSLLIPECGDDFIQYAATTPDHAAWLSDVLHCRSLIAVPISAEGETIGTATFLRDTVSEPFDELDRIAAEELGARLGLALRYAKIRQDLAAERARLDAILASVPVGVLVADAEGRVVLGNAELDRVLGSPLQTTASFSGYGERNAMTPQGEPLPPHAYPMVRAIQNRETVRGDELLYRRGDGSASGISASSAPVLSPEGKLLGGVVAVVDIDEQKRSREQLRRSEERFRILLDRASVGISIGDETGALTYANPALLDLIGYSADDLQHGRIDWRQLTPERCAQADRDALRQLRTRGFATPYQKSYRAKDGRLVPVLLSAVMIPSLGPDGAKQDIAAFFTDLTAQKLAENALLQSEKLAAVGKLASSISHEINNPLEAVTNLLFIVRTDPTLPRYLLSHIEHAERELSRVAQVTSQTLRFHRQSTSPVSVQPHILIEEVLALYATRLANSEIRIVRDYSPSTAITCYEGDIRQVFNNLIGNAFDAMRLGGRLTIRTCNATRWSTGERGVRIVVADTGTGMPHEVRSHIFNAFYTTKGMGGTGLGLWISSRIVHKHRGYIRAYSSTRPRTRGSVFTVWLPHQLAHSASEPWHLEDGALT